ncbi:MAG TPA: hypothetical protein PKH07_04555 [bacterium]|nr:hypothetical protein [bacterium]
MTERDRVRAVVHSCLARWRWASFINALAQAVIALLVAAFVLTGVSKLIFVPRAVWMVAWFGLGVVLLARVACLWHPPRMQRALRVIDERLGLKDALVTALELLSSKDSSWHECIFSDVLNRFASVDVRKACAMMPSRRVAALAALSVVCLGVIHLVPSRNVLSVQLLDHIQQLSEDSKLLAESLMRSKPGPRARSIAFRALELLERIQEFPSSVAEEEVSQLIAELQSYPPMHAKSSAGDTRSGSGTGSGSGTAKGSGISSQNLAQFQKALADFRSSIQREQQPSLQEPTIVVNPPDIAEASPRESQVGATTSNPLLERSRKSILDKLVQRPSVDEIPVQPYEIQEEPIPWNRIPLWQQPIVRRYFSRDKDSP